MPQPLTLVITGEDRTGQAARSAVDNVQQIERSTGKAGGALRGMGTAAAAAASVTATAGAVAGVGFFKLANSASDMNETVNKTRVVFPQSADSIIAWSKNAETSFGLSEQAALAATSQFGDMFHQLGYSEQGAASASKQVVKLAADLGSFHNVDPSDVLERISAGFRGEYDSLQQLIPNINAARVETEALRMTHKSSTKELTAAEKATAVLAIIQRDGANAANDFAETSGNAANQQRILKAQFQTTSATIGQRLIPMFTAGLRVANQFLGGLTGNVTKMDQSARPRLEMFGLGVRAMAQSMRTGSVTSTGFIGRMQQVGAAVRTAGTWIRQHIMPQLREFAGWIRERVIPVVGQLARDRLAALRSAFGNVQRAIQQNRPQLQQLWNLFRLVANIIVGQVIPVVARVSNMWIRVFGVAIRGAINMLGLLVRAFRPVLTVALSTFGGIINGAARAFGWVPGVGGRLRTAARAFNQFRDQVNRAFAGITNRKTITVTARGTIIFPDGRAVSAGTRAQGGGGSQRAYAAGGRVRGPGTGTSDSIVAYGPDGYPNYRLSNDEHVWTAREVRNAGGHGAVEQIRQLFRYANGGGINVRPQLVEGLTDGVVRLANNMVERIAQNAARRMEGYAPRLTGGIGWQAMMAALRRVFPGLALISGFRPGAITATGNRSYHGMGRAVDIPPVMRVFDWIRANYMAQTRELIFSPAGGQQVWNGRPHMYSGITRANHWDHIHWAMARGGMIREPVLGVGRSGATYSFAENGPERVLSPSETAAYNRPLVVQVVVDGRVLAESLVRYQRRGGRMAAA